MLSVKLKKLWAHVLKNIYVVSLTNYECVTTNLKIKLLNYKH